MSRIRLIASSDDYLLELRMVKAVAEVCAELGGEVEPEPQSDEASPESVATELVSPSLFAAERVLVIPDVRVWVDGAAPAGPKPPRETPPDPQPLVQVLAEGVPEGMGLVMGAWCGRKPSGPLVDAVNEAGIFEWIPLPPPPKPWEDALLSNEQRQVLEGVLQRTAEGVVFSPRATLLLLERLGFAPRLLIQEVRKLAGAAAGAEVDEALVRRLTFPRERSLEVVRDAVLERRLAPLLDLIAAASSGAPVNDWHGQRLEPGGLAQILVSQVTNLLHQMLYLRQFAEAAGIAAEMAPETTSRNGWYNRHFKSALAPKLLERLKDDAPSPLFRPKAKPPTPFSLSGLFAGAGHYTTAELTAAVVAASRVEEGIRGEHFPLESLTVWFSGFMGGARETR
ncbi:MAG: hypothetical protein V2I67_01340 [Thermoanaerobaculales bacterium]|jgi:hypothetical protein|nr:hypothetical protein [Thermoanaerobaculales bacterium]